MNSRNRINVVASAALAMAFGMQVHAQDKPVEMKFGFWVPAQHTLAKTSIEPWAKSIEAASKGSIKVALFPASNWARQPTTTTWPATASLRSPGSARATRLAVPMFAASELPFLISQPGTGSAAVDAWYRKHAEKEMKDVKYCFAHIHIGTLHSKKPITEPGQIKGMKIRPANGTVAQTMVHLGASNVQVSAPESRDALEKGVADAHHLPWDSLISFNIDKAVKFHLDTKLYAASFVWVINKPWFEGLSANQKKVINDHCSNEWAAKVGEGWGGAEDAGEAKLAATAGHTIVQLTPEQVRTWKRPSNPSRRNGAKVHKRAAQIQPRCSMTSSAN